MTLGGSVRAELRLGWFTCSSVLVSPTADVLQRRRETDKRAKEIKADERRQQHKDEEDKERKPPLIGYLNNLKGGN